MDQEQNRDYERQSHHHGEENVEREETREDCGCGGHGHHVRYGYGMKLGWHHEVCRCDCHGHHGGMGFHRRFISQEEIIARLEDYLKQLQAEARGVEERITELKKKGQPEKS